jgi:cyclopropane fatty-acyl-phospholipid synthase-like methyltransferase
VSQTLAPYCKKIIGVDISQGMVDWYNMCVWNQGIEWEEMKAVCVELKGTEDELDGVKFDVAIVSLSAYTLTSFESFCQ